LLTWFISIIASGLAPVGTPFLLDGPDFAGDPGDILRGQGNSWKRKSDTLQILDILIILTHLSADHKMIL
jgi:hypothetical protein